MRRTQNRTAGWRRATWPIVVLALLPAGPILKAAESPTPSPTQGAAAWKGRPIQEGVRLGRAGYRVYGHDGSSTGTSMGPSDQRDVIVTREMGGRCSPLKSYSSPWAPNQPKLPKNVNQLSS